MGIEVSGKLHTIYETKQVSERFSKREFVLEMADNPKYPQLVLFQLTSDRVTQLDEHRVGDEVRIEFSLRGREWKSPQGDLKYFNSLDVWKLEAGRSNARARSSSQGGNGNGYRTSGVNMDARDAEIPPRGDDDFRRSATDDDLPF